MTNIPINLAIKSFIVNTSPAKTGAPFGRHILHHNDRPACAVRGQRAVHPVRSVRSLRVGAVRAAVRATRHGVVRVTLAHLVTVRFACRFRVVGVGLWEEIVVLGVYDHYKW